MHTSNAASRSTVIYVRVAMILMLGRSPCTAKTREQDAIHNADQRDSRAFLVREKAAVDGRGVITVGLNIPGFMSLYY